MLLYTEAHLDAAYRIDCKARAKANVPWIKREQFRPVYEELVESFMSAYREDFIFGENIPEYLLDSVNELLEITLNLEK